MIETYVENHIFLGRIAELYDFSIDFCILLPRSAIDNVYLTNFDFFGY